MKKDNPLFNNRALASESVELPRIAKVIGKVTGVSYQPGHVWRIVRSMGWNSRKPAKRAIERDESGMARLKKRTWPKVKETPAISFC